MRLPVLFDGGCPLCRRTVRIIRALDWNDRLQFVDATNAEARAFFAPTLTEAQVMVEMYVVDARQRLHAQVAQEPTTWCEIEEVVVVDRAYKAILQRAASEPVDLIVMGAQGAGGLELMLYGSNTQHVVRAAPCPVLTVHA